MHRGWVKIHRKIEDWEWYTDANTFRVFFHLLVKSNHKENKWQGITVLPGQIITSADTIAEALKLSRQQVRTSLNKLKSTNEITIKPTNKYSLVTIETYAFHQSGEDLSTNKSTNNTTNDQPTNNQQITTNKNVNNEKNEKKSNFVIPSVDEIKAYCTERNNNIQAQYFYDYNSARGWMVGKNKMKDWKAAIRTWENNDKQRAEEKKPVYKRETIS